MEAVRVALLQAMMKKRILKIKVAFNRKNLLYLGLMTKSCTNQRVSFRKLINSLVFKISIMPTFLKAVPTI